MLSLTMSGNPQARRAEAEILDGTGNSLALIYEDSNGWHVEESTVQFDRDSEEYKIVLQGVKQELSKYTNRKGENPPPNLTADELAKWLMKKRKWFWS